jgi:hypothetical protein
LGWSALRRYPIVYHGLTAGLLGAATVGLWFFLVDLAHARPFLTPASLGSAILLGAQGPTDVRLNAGVILAYSFLHVTAFVLVGWAFAWFAGRMRGGSGYWLRAAVLLLLVEVLFLGTVASVAGWVLQALGAVPILIANLLAVLSIGVWVWRKLQAPATVPAAGVNRGARPESAPGSHAR